MTELPLVEVLSVPVTSIAGDPSRLRVVLKNAGCPAQEAKARIKAEVADWLSGKSQVLCLVAGWDLSFVLLGPAPEHDQTDLGASDDRPLGPDHPVYRGGSS